MVKIIFFEADFLTLRVMGVITHDTLLSDGVRSAEDLKTEAASSLRVGLNTKNCDAMELGIGFDGLVRQRMNYDKYLY